MDVNFIKELHKGNADFIEIRQIDQYENITQKFFKLNEIEEYQIPIDENIYIGIFSRSYKSGKDKSCNNTGTLFADYDYMTLEVVKEKIQRAMIPYPSVFIDSGHGIHAYWLLDRRANEITDILKAIVRLTGSDARCTDKARIMRLPGTINVKGNPIECKVIEANYKRYSIELFKSLLDTKYQSIDCKQGIPELLNADRPCIRALASGVKEGHRNFAEGRIIKYLQMKGKTKEVTKQIIQQWNLHNSPKESTDKLLKDFESYWNTDYKLLGCAVNNQELQSILYDYCNKADCNLSETIGRLNLGDTIKYNNRSFNYIEKLKGNDLIILGLLIRHKEGLSMSTLINKITSRATNKPCMCKKTLLGSLHYLKTIGFVDVVEGNKRAGKENSYKAIPQGTFGMGYTICSNGAINGAIDGRVTQREFKLYVVLLKYAFKKGSCYPSQVTLAREVGTTQPEISMLLKNLDEADYIKRNTSYLKGAESRVYTLLV